MTDRRKRVTGIGGIFFKTKDPESSKAWYEKHLGLDTDQYGTCFEWRVWLTMKTKRDLVS